MLKWFALIITLAVSANADAFPSDTTPWAMPLNGPWKFAWHDNLQWASPSYSDAGWFNVDLTPAPGATDGDVGLVGYVPGFEKTMASGTYNGYVWYRLTINLSPAQANDLHIAGPTDVDDIYQLYVNGHLLGQMGDFSGKIPSVYSIKPKLFRIPQNCLIKDTMGNYKAMLAFRVWVSARTIGEAGDAGGLHIAPWMGNAQGIADRYSFEQGQTFWGYVVDAVEPAFFVLLALLALWKGGSSRWMALACLLTALVRVQQVLYYWTDGYSLHTYYLMKDVILIPLQLMAWTYAWYMWFYDKHIKLYEFVPFICCLLLIGGRLITGSYMYTKVPSGDIIPFIGEITFLGFLTQWGIYGVKNWRWKSIGSLVAMLILSIGLFPKLFNMMGIPGIWFPFGVGVSRTQFAYAAFIPLMAVLLIRPKAVTLPKPYLHVK